MKGLITPYPHFISRLALQSNASLCLLTQVHEHSNIKVDIVSMKRYWHDESSLVTHGHFFGHDFSKLNNVFIPTSMQSPIYLK